MKTERDYSRITESLKHSFQELCAGRWPWPLFVSGRAGLGKTCAALALLDYCSGVYFTAVQLCEELILANHNQLYLFQEQRGQYPLSISEMWQIIKKSRLAIIDELGTKEGVSSFHYESVKRFIDERNGKPLIVLSNHDLEEIERIYDDRISSRLAAGTVVKLEGTDRRIG